MRYLIPRTQTVKLDSSGAGTATIVIDNSNQRWIIDLATVSTDQADAAPVPTCLIYLDETFMGGSRQGNMDTAQGRVVMYPDSVLSARWSGGIPGSIATVSVSGTFDPAGLPLDD